MDPHHPYQQPTQPGYEQLPGMVMSPTHSAAPVAPAQVPKRPRRHHALIALLAFALLIVLGGAAAVIIIRYQPPKKGGSVPPQRQLCFVRTGYLNCVDALGSNRVRYDLPTPQGGITLTNVVPAGGQSKFLAYSAYDPLPNDIWMLDSKLVLAGKLTIPAGLTASTPSWSRDGQTILLALENAQNSQQIYRLNPSSNSLQQLTSAAALTSTPYETTDGHILYGVLDSATGAWQPYVMNSDGGYAHPLGDLSALASITGFSYDPLSNTVFVYGTAASGEQEIVYANATTFFNDGATQILAANVGSGDTVGLVDSSAIFIRHNSVGSIIGTNGNQPITVSQFGVPVGVLNVASFHRSSQQTEQAHERIINLSDAPSDFATSIGAIFDQGDHSCQANPAAQSDGQEFLMVINQVVSDKYAVVQQGCGPLAMTYYALNSSNAWVQVAQGDTVPACAVIAPYGFPQSIFQQCYNTTGNLVPNTGTAR